MSNEKFISAVAPGHALESLRNSDFDFYSALFEVIDNSIQAEANNIWLTVEYEKIKRSDMVSYVSILDDGHGMAPEVLHNCMSLGYSTRYDRRDGIGRFGVGMTLAAISQCQSIYSISKTEEDDEWIGTVLDLPKIASGDFSGIPSPSTSWTPKKTHSKGVDYKSLGSGTLIVWSNFDRVSYLPADSNVTNSELDMRIGRVFRKWLSDNKEGSTQKRKINIYLNGKKVLPFDPLYADNTKRFPDDPTALDITTQEFEYPIPEEVINKGLSNGKSKSKIIIRMSLLPESFRKERGRGGRTTEFTGRYLERNEGVSILRAGREVHYDHLKYYKPAFKEQDRWWSCEISFDPVLDSLFTVKNIKLGVRIHKELQELISKKIQPTRNKYLDEVQKTWDKSASQGQTNKKSEHAINEALKKGKTKTSNKKKTEDEIEQEQREIIDRLAKDKDEQYKAKLLERFKSKPYSIEESSWPGSIFFDEQHLGDSTIMIINRKHPFYDTIFRPLQEHINESDEGGGLSLVKSGTELLLVSFINTLKNLKMDEHDNQLDWEEVENKIKHEWGEHLRSFINELNKNGY